MIKITQNYQHQNRYKYVLCSNSKCPHNTLCHSHNGD